MKVITIPRRGFTLVELLAVIAIVGILAAILIPIVGAVRKSANNTQCLSNLRQHGSAVRLYANDHNNKLPTLNFNYVSDLWPYLVNSKTEAPTFSGPSFPDGLRGTCFECPLMDNDVDAASERSYGVNSFIRLYYLKGGEDNQNYSDSSLLLIQQPENTVIFADTHSRSNLSNDRWEQISQRHDGHVNVVFVDGHVDSVAGDDERATTYNTVFWRGKDL
ncbi:prepilin-type N-terminal cleavage/methylation domain-containing protein [Cerasicoccus arenae]|nr:prepilin-type N-terminal cleavage/methylation domain-containing protein [Cerasicoccus arenae]